MVVPPNRSDMRVAMSSISSVLIRRPLLSYFGTMTAYSLSSIGMVFCTLLLFL